MLLQNFLDRSSDLQTAAYVASYIQAFNSLPQWSPIRICQRIIRDYRETLNRIKLWNVRAAFDVQRNLIKERYLDFLFEEKKENSRYFKSLQESKPAAQVEELKEEEKGETREVIKQELQKGLQYLIEPEDKRAHEVGPVCYKCNVSYSIIKYV